MNFFETYSALSALYKTDLKESVLTEAKYTEAQPIDLSNCRMITSDVKDIRGEFEASACLEYNGELTRVQARTVIIRETENGKEFLGKAGRSRVRLPGGGFDADKDSDILDTAEREAYEEFNLVLTNLKDTGVCVWSSRQDPWVTKHVANEEDRWTGYYTWYVIAEVKSVGDNDRPEEINKWQWLPIERLGEVNAKLPAFVDSLNEAIHPDKEGRADLGEISYLCDSLSTLRKILSRMEIQKTYVPEVRYEVGEKDGNTQRIKQMSLSTSTNLTGHAERRPNKWGFGVILDGAVLSKYYDIEYYNHADHKLQDLRLTKLVKLHPEAPVSSRVIIMLGEYGNRLISPKDNADIEVYNCIMSFLKNNPQYLSHPDLKTKANYLKANGQWRYHPFGSEKGKHDSRFTHLQPYDIEELFVWPYPFSKNGVPFAALDAHCDGRLSELLGTYSSFKEEEERIWVENNLVNFVQIPKPALSGIILPEFFKADYNAETPTNNDLVWLKRFVADHGIRVDWHEFSDPGYYQAELERNNTSEKEAQWTALDRVSSDNEVILKRARMNKLRFMKGQITQDERDQASRDSVVATAAVKLAIEKYMQDLSVENYDSKYQEALAAAKEYYAETLVKGYLTPKPNKQIEELFNLYCPDPPAVEETN